MYEDWAQTTKVLSAQLGNLRGRRAGRHEGIFWDCANPVQVGVCLAP